MTRRLTTRFDVAAGASCLSAMRVADPAAAAGVALLRQPFLPGPIFATFDRPQGASFCREDFRARFERDGGIAAPETLARCLVRAEVADGRAAEAVGDACRPSLGDATGPVGAPGFTYGVELFRGDDRLEQALDRAGRG